MKINRYLDPEQGQGGSGGTGTGEDPELKEFETLSTQEYGKLKPEDKVKFDALKAKYEAEYVDAEGKPLTPDQIKVYRENETKLNAILAKPEKDRTAEDIAFLKDNTEETSPNVKVYDAVDEMTGIKYDIDYGDIDPESPEGIVKRETVIREEAYKEFDNNLKANNPEGYRYLVYLEKGGKPENYFKPENRDWKAVAVPKADAAEQERVFRAALGLKGIKPDLIDTIVQATKDKGKLYEESKSELEALQKTQEANEALEEQKEIATREETKKAHAQFISAVNAELGKGVGGNPIPIKERQAFYDFIVNYATYQGNGKYMIHRELNMKELSKELQMEYFRFKGGNLKEVVDAKSKQDKVIRLKGGIKVKFAPKGSGGPKTRVRLSDLN